MLRLTFIAVGLVCCFNINSLGAQKLPVSFVASLNQMDLLMAIPTEQRYRSRPVRINEWFTADYILRFRKKKKVEIQYALIPEAKLKNLIPQVHTFRTVTHLGTNEEEYSTIAVHQVSETDLIKNFNADWAKVTYFQPKRSFSRYQHCKMLSMYKSGKGMAYVLFLFNEPNEEIEQQFYALRFK